MSFFCISRLYSKTAPYTCKSIKAPFNSRGIWLKTATNIRFLMAGSLLLSTGPSRGPLPSAERNGTFSTYSPTHQRPTTSTAPTYTSKSEAMPVTEICIFPASEAYRQDQSTVHPFARALASVPGFISFYHGLEIEDPSVGYGFVVWESLEAHQAFSASPAFGPALMLLTPSFGGAPSIIHARFDTDPTAALTSPTLEYVVLTVREGSSKKAVTEILQKIGHKDLPTVLGAAYGPVVEKEDAIVLAVGWESVEAQSALIRSFSPKMFKDFGTLVERADLHVKHVKMTKV